MDLSSITAENVGAAIGIGVLSAYLAIREYLKKRKAPAAPNAADVVVAGGTIADMGPFRGMEAHLKRLSDAAEAIRDMMIERALDEEKEEEIVRRAEIMAQQMLRELRPSERPARTRRRKPP